MQITLGHVTSFATLRMLDKAGRIEWPVAGGKAFTYVDTINDVTSFTHNNQDYKIEYRPGCFYPYLFYVNYKR